MKARNVLLAGVVCGLLQPAFGADPRPGPLKPDDFAYGIDIEAPAGGSLYKATLTEDVYRGLKKQGLQDIRVFNGAGEVIPYSLQHELSEERRSSVRLPIPLFPIEGSPAEAQPRNAVELREDASGKVVNVRFSGQKEADPGPVRAYLLDLRKQEHGLRSLEFERSSATEANRVVPVKVEASDDLQSWHGVGSGALAKLTNQGETVERKRIELQETRGRFLKITWDDVRPLNLDAASGEFVSTEKIERARSWTKVAGQVKPPRPGVVPRMSAGEEFIFDAGGQFPVDSLKVLLPEANMYLRISISTSHREEGPWMPFYTGTVHRVIVDGKEMTSAPIKLGYPMSKRYWVLTVEGRDSNLNGRAPVLELGWVPHQVHFLARGTGPFRLAYGSAVAGPAEFGVPSLVAGLSAATEGQPVTSQPAQLVGGQKELGGVARLTPPPEVKTVPWKQWALWAALGLAVLVVAGMAWRLFRELSAKPS